MGYRRPVRFGHGSKNAAAAVVRVLRCRGHPRCGDAVERLPPADSWDLPASTRRRRGVGLELVLGQLGAQLAAAGTVLVPA